jgi:O-antigen/teichoic acid export membrane protein
MLNFFKTYFTDKLYLKNLFFTYFSQSVTAITLLILTPFLTYSIGINNLGIYGVLLNIISFSVIFDFGFNAGLLRKYIFKSINYENLTNNLFIFFIGLLFFLIPIIIFILIYFVQITKFSSLFFGLLLSIIVVQNILILFFETIIQTYNLIYISKILRSCKVVIEFILIFVFLKLINLNILLIITSLVNIFILLFFYIYLYKNYNFKISFKNFSLNLIINHFIYSIWYFFTSLATVLVFNTQIIIINFLIGSNAAAKFLIITRFFDIIRIAITNFTQVLTPQIIYVEIENNWLKIKNLFLTMIKRIITLSLFFAVLIHFYGPYFFIKWSNLNDNTTLEMFQLYIVFITLIIIDNVSFIFINALKINKETTLMSILQGIINLLLTYIFVIKFGIIGAIYASLISFIMTNMIYNPYHLLKTISNKNKFDLFKS